MARIRRRQSRKIRTHDKAEGVDFVRCAICGKHLRVISGRHLSTHGTDRDTYIEEYRLSPDQLCAKEFRRLHSSRPGYYPHRKRDWIAAIKRIHKRDGQVSSGYIQCKYPHIYNQGLWIFGDWIQGCLQRISIQQLCGGGSFEIAQRLSRKYAGCA